MSSNALKELLLYRYRYVVGYAVLAILSVSLTLWHLDSIPPGFSDLEKQTAVISNNLQYASQSFVNLPYHSLQKATLALFGPSAWGVRLPSVLLSLALVTTTFFLLQRWFRGNMAVIGTILVATSVYFLINAREGTVDILYYLWPALLLLTASLADTDDGQWRLWLGLFTVTAGLSLYTPYMVFFLAALVVVAVFSRAGKALMAEIDGPAVAMSGLLLLTLLAPLIYSVSQQPDMIFDYIGVAQAPSLAFTVERLQTIAYTLVGYGATSGTFYPVLSLPLLALGLYGLYHAVRHVSRISYAVMVLWAFTAVVLFVNSDGVPTAILFVPLALLVVTGLWSFVTFWYGLFPRNPYARIFALLPIALLLLVVVQHNYQRYFYGLPHSENVRTAYDQDILLLQRKLSSEPRIGSLTVLVPQDEQPFVRLLENRYGLITVATAEREGINYSGDALIVAEEVADSLPADAKRALASRSPDLIVNDSAGDNALRFRVYQ